MIDVQSPERLLHYLCKIILQFEDQIQTFVMNVNYGQRKK